MSKGLLKLLMMLSLAFAVGCSNSSGQKQELSDSEMDMFDDDFLADGDDLFLDSDLDYDPLFDDQVETQPVISEFSPGIGEYQVKKGDTLLLIAFNIYGDYTKWRNISALNGNVRHIREGQVLQYEIPEHEFVWNPRGNPHLIQMGETLGTISYDKYGVESRWRDLYENNQPMIQNPNLIFAGFTLYYIPDRDLASKADETSNDGLGDLFEDEFVDF